MVYIDRDDLYAKSGYAPESGLLLAKLDTEEAKLWKMFKNDLHLDNYSYFQDRRIQGKAAEVSIDAHHPFVPFLSNFALSAYNKLCRMFYKKDEEENIYDAQVTNVRYSYIDYGFIFFVTLEALEDNVIGVYEATVICHFHDGLRALIKFIRVLRPPMATTLYLHEHRHAYVHQRLPASAKPDVAFGNLDPSTFSMGWFKLCYIFTASNELKLANACHLINYCTKYKGMTDLIHEKSLSDYVKEKKESLESLLAVRDIPRRGQLKKDYAAYKGACRILDKYSLQLNQTSRKIKKKYSGGWLFPDEKYGLQIRSNEHTCEGYDYVNPLKVFSSYTSMMPLGHLQ